MEKVYQITESTLLALLRNSYEYGAKYQRAAHSEWHGGNENELPTRNEYLNEVVSNLKEVQQVVGGIDWIRCSERLPEERAGYSHSEDVNVLLRNCKDSESPLFVSTACYQYLNTKKWCEYLYGDRVDKGDFEVVAWQPLPPNTLEEYTAPVSVVGGIDWEGLEAACEHWCHIEFKEPPCPAKVMEWLKTNLHKYSK